MARIWQADGLRFMDYSGGELIPPNLISSSLRQRPAWASTTAGLLQTNGTRWKEVSLSTHDIALSIPQPHSEGYDVFSLLLLSSEDINDEKALARIQQLHGLTNSRNAAVIFLLDAPSAMHSFMELHIKLTQTYLPNYRRMQASGRPLPIIPLAPSSQDDATGALATALETFQASLAASRAAAAHTWLPADAARDLLPWCAIINTTGAGSIKATKVSIGKAAAHSNSVTCAAASGNVPLGLSRRSVEVLSANWMSFREILEVMSTEEGRGIIGGMLKPAEAEGLMAFWGHEFATS
ncbi:hypothetical protein VTI74DRAFT_10536 [Chaetomium olivicolor]